MAQNFGMMANYEEPKDKAKSATIGAAQQLEGYPTEPKVKKPWVQPSDPREATETREGPRRRREQVHKSRVEK
jgi:hypothetical protein